tara:strand:+ start:1235 stop:2092 length:858 start_codon:yes stop_codon:yes gene_type:complete
MSARNNQERTGAKPSVPSPVNNLDFTQQQNFSFPKPTEFVELPSQGLFYPEDHPLHGVDAVEIRFMTAKDEDTLSSQALIRRGVALDRFIQDIIVDKRIKIEDLLVCDKNAIIIKARITGYGEDYKTKITCPSCSSTVPYTFNLSDLDVITTEALQEAGLEISSEGTFTVELPRSKATVTARLMTGRDEKQLVQAAKKNKGKNAVDRTLTNQLKTLIKDVEGRTEKQVINHFVDTMPAIDSRYLRNYYAARIPKVDLTREFSCEECGHVAELEVPLSVDFFWPRE